jgi:hypothetical protein
LDCGTNDLEKYHDYTDIVQKTSEIINLINEKYPEGKGILSSLLPRMDTHHAQVGKINKVLKTNYSTKSSVLFVKHNNLFPSRHHLYDKKHLNQSGVKIFEKKFEKKS